MSRQHRRGGREWETDDQVSAGLSKAARERGEQPAIGGQQGGHAGAGDEGHRHKPPAAGKKSVGHWILRLREVRLSIGKTRVIPRGQDSAKSPQLLNFRPRGPSDDNFGPEFRFLWVTRAW